MSRLLKLKQWLTVEDAARHLSGMFGEPVNRVDILQLALDGRLTLSVHLVNTAVAKRGSIKPFEDAAYRELSPEIVSMMDLPEAARDKPVWVLEGTRVHGDRIVEVSDELVRLEGVYDLAMLGNEARDVQNELQKLTGGPSVNGHTLDGTFVVGSEAGEVFQVQERLTREARHHAQATLKMAFAVASLRSAKPPQLSPFDLDSSSCAAWPEQDDYVPAPGLPSDAVLVVRTSSLLRLQAAGIDDDAKEKPTGSRERATYLNIIGGLIGVMLGKSAGGKPYSMFESQAAVIDALLANYPGRPGIAKTTLETKLAEAKRSLDAS
jgi:hypothetical protein